MRRISVRTAALGCAVVGAVSLSLPNGPAQVDDLLRAIARVDTAREAGDRNALKDALTELGLRAVPAGHLGLAVRSLDEALALTPEHAPNGARALALLQSGYALQQVGQYERALERYESAAASYAAHARSEPDRKTEMLAGELYARVNVATVLSGWLGRPDEAIDMLVAVHDAASAIGARDLVALAALNLAEIYAEERRLELSTAAAAEAERIYSSLGERAMVAASAVTHAKALIFGGDVTAAGAEAARAGAIAREIGDLGIERIARRREGWAAELAGDEQAALAHYREAVSIIERLRRQTVLEELQISFLRNKLDVHEGLVRILHGLHARDPRAGHDRDALRVSEGSRYRSFLDDLPRAAGSVTVDRPLELEEIQSLLSHGDLLIEYFFGAEQSVYLFAVSRDGMEFLDLGGSDEIAEDVELLAGLLVRREGLSDRVRERAGALYRELLAPVLEARTNVEALIVVPDGPLFKLPFEVLLDVRGGARVPVSYAPSATVLGALRSAAAEIGERPLDLLAVAATRPTSAAVEAGPALDRVDEEVARVSRYFAAERRLTMIDPSEPDLVRAMQRGATVFHFAGHARIDVVDPGESGLILDGSKSEELALTAREVAQIPLRSDMIVLSGCSTATGEFAPGEGHLGLSRAFLRAGGKSVLATLWDVGDDSAYRMTTALYEEVARGASLRDALAAARERQGRDPDRYAFVLIGDGSRPVAGVLPRSSILRRATGAGLVAAGVALILIRRRRR